MYETIVNIVLFGAIIAGVSTVAYVRGRCADATDEAARTGEPVAVFKFNIMGEDIVFQAKP